MYRLALDLGCPAPTSGFGTVCVPCASTSIPSAGFNGSTSVVSDATHVWVTNSFISTVTEVNATPLSLDQDIAATPANGIADPLASTIDHTHVWVLNGDDSLTELPTS